MQPKVTMIVPKARRHRDAFRSCLRTELRTRLFHSNRVRSTVSLDVRLCAFTFEGRFETITFVVIGEQLAAALGAEMVVLNRAGHNDVLSSPFWDTFASAMTRLLKNV